MYLSSYIWLFFDAEIGVAESIAVEKKTLPSHVKEDVGTNTQQYCMPKAFFYWCLCAFDAIARSISWTIANRRWNK